MPRAQRATLLYCIAELTFLASHTFTYSMATCKFTRKRNLNVR